MDMMQCPNCDHTMDHVHQHDACPNCGWIVGCCEGRGLDPGENIHAVPITVVQEGDGSP